MGEETKKEGSRGPRAHPGMTWGWGRRKSLCLYLLPPGAHPHWRLISAIIFLEALGLSSLP